MKDFPVIVTQRVWEVLPFWLRQKELNQTRLQAQQGSLNINSELYKIWYLTRTAIFNTDKMYFLQNHVHVKFDMSFVVIRKISAAPLQYMGSLRKTK